MDSQKTIKSYNVLGDDVYYHHTRSENTGESYYHPPGTHKQHELLLLLEGEISYVIEGETYPVREGDMIFVAPNEVHTIKVSGDRPYERIVLLFDMSILSKMTKELEVELNAFSYDGKNRFHVIKRELVKEYELDRLLLEIIGYEDSNPYKKLLIMSRLIDFSVSIDKMITQNRDKFALPDKKDSLISSAVEYIDRHIRKPISLDELCEAFYVSKSTLCHKFSEFMNMTVLQYITVKKMNFATQMLKNGHTPPEVAAMAGYENYTTFFYNYKKTFGKPPSSALKD